jgi:hypothetical protein
LDAINTCRDRDRDDNNETMKRKSKQTGGVDNGIRTAREVYSDFRLSLGTDFIEQDNNTLKVRTHLDTILTDVLRILDCTAVPP